MVCKDFEKTKIRRVQLSIIDCCAAHSVFNLYRVTWLLLLVWSWHSFDFEVLFEIFHDTRVFLRNKTRPREMGKNRGGGGLLNESRKGRATLAGARRVELKV